MGVTTEIKEEVAVRKTCNSDASLRGILVARVTAPNERWSLDFMHDRLANVRQFRALTVGDDFTKECLALEIAHSFRSADVIRVFQAIAFERRLPSPAFPTPASTPDRYTDCFTEDFPTEHSSGE